MEKPIFIQILTKQLEINSLIVSDQGASISKKSRVLSQYAIDDPERKQKMKQVADTVNYIRNTFKEEYFRVTDVCEVNSVLKYTTVKSVLDTCVKNNLMELAYKSPKGGYGNIYRVIPKDERPSEIAALRA